MSWSPRRAPTRRTGRSTTSWPTSSSSAVPLTSRTTRLFLGQQIQCTQCHDHPSNDWKQADFWGINAFFKGMKTEEVRKADATGSGGLRPHRAAGRADRRLRQLRPAQRPGRDRLPAVSRRSQDQPGHRRDPPGRAGQADRRPQERGAGQGVRQSDVGPLPRPRLRQSGR